MRQFVKVSLVSVQPFYLFNYIIYIILLYNKIFSMISIIIVTGNPGALL